MLFKRKKFDKLLMWKEESNDAIAMLIEGARRIGKSTAVEEFAKQNYRSYILIDFGKVKNLNAHLSTLIMEKEY